MCSFTTECVLLQQKGFPYYRVCRLQHCYCQPHYQERMAKQNVFFYNRMCSLATECLVFSTLIASLDTKQNVFFYNRKCSLTTECVVFSTVIASLDTTGKTAKPANPAQVGTPALEELLLRCLNPKP